jgi:hypothetical protein
LPFDEIISVGLIVAVLLAEASADGLEAAVATVFAVETTLAGVVTAIVGTALVCFEATLAVDETTPVGDEGFLIGRLSLDCGKVVFVDKLLEGKFAFDFVVGNLMGWLSFSCVFGALVEGKLTGPGTVAASTFDVVTTSSLFGGC